MTELLTPRSRRVGLLLGALGLCAGLFGLAGCGDPIEDPADVVVFDFARDLDVAETGFERSRLRAADPVFADRIGVGWGSVEVDPAGGSFRWTLGTRAEFEVFVAKPRDVTLVCRCETLNWQGAPPQMLSVEVGEFRSPGVPLAPPSIEIAVPHSAWQVGWNRLTLVASRAAAPIDVIAGNEDARELGVRVEALEFRGLHDSEPPTVDAGGLHMSVGSLVRSFGEAAGQRWQLSDVETEGGVRLGAFLRTADGRRPLDEGPLDVGTGHEMAIELVAEPMEPSWWHRLLGESDGPGEVRVGRAQVLLSPDRMPGSGADVAGDAGSRGSATGVLVYMIDTLRADRLGAYGSQLGLTPRLDELARDAVVFTEARAQSSWTRPSVASTFTGLYPQVHGIADRNDGLSAEVDTLAERLYAAGVATGGIITNGNVSHRFGLGQGFATYRHLRETRGRESVHVPADELNQWGIHWLEENVGASAGQPFFLYLHATDPHAPYTPREPFASRFAAGADRSLGTLDAFRGMRRQGGRDPRVREQLLALYNAEVAWTDHQFGVLADALRERGLWRSTMIVVVADHGEEFLDHGHWEHGGTLYDEQLLVPLLVKLPEGVGEARRIDGHAGHVDLAPTILDALGVDYDPEDFDGRSLWPALVGAADRANGAPPLSHLELSVESQRGVVAGDWKLIDDLNRKRKMLFRMSVDPAEQHDLSAERPLRTGVLDQERRRLEQQRQAGSADEIELDEETKKQLEALGYAG